VPVGWAPGFELSVGAAPVVSVEVDPSLDPATAVLPLRLVE
jgi:hypothetical protein